MAKDDQATKSALLLALTPKGKSDDSEPDKKEDDNAEDAQAILDAIDEKDPDALRSALRGFVSACMADYDKEEE